METKGCVCLSVRLRGYGFHRSRRVIHEFMKFAAAQAIKHQPKSVNARWDPKEEAKFKEWAKLACGWARDLTPYQSPTLQAVAISMRREEDDENDMIVIHTVDDMRTELLRQGVPPDELGRALLGPQLIEHDEEEKPTAKEKPKVKKTVVGSDPGVVQFCEICQIKTLHVDGVCALANMHKASAE
jgi:hypothetical protein